MNAHGCFGESDEDWRGVSPVKQATIRGIDGTLERRLREEARRRGLSLNRTVLLLLRQATGLAKPTEYPERRPKRFTDLDHLAGTWSDAQADEFDKAVEVFEQIDGELWSEAPR